MNNDLHAKALRAAEWWNSQEHLHSVSLIDSCWICVTDVGTFSWTDEQFLKEAPSYGWIDTAELHTSTEEEAPDICLKMMGQFMNELDTAEDEGVEWEWSYEQGWYGPYLLSTRSVCNEFEWTLTSSSKAPECVMLRGEATTRAEARRAAIEAARGLGSDSAKSAQGGE